MLDFLWWNTYHKNPASAIDKEQADKGMQHSLLLVLWPASGFSCVTASIADALCHAKPQLPSCALVRLVAQALWPDFGVFMNVFRDALDAAY